MYRFVLPMMMRESPFVMDGAEGATTPETLRHPNRIVRTIWRETLGCVHRRGSFNRYAVQAKLSGTVTDGAHR
jgi:hypothetical protein